MSKILGQVLNERLTHSGDGHCDARHDDLTDGRVGRFSGLAD